MNKLLFIALFQTFSVIGFCQHVNTSTIDPGEFKNVQTFLIAEDSLSSTFIIWVKKAVAEHYHAKHTENIYVLEGEGQMTLGDRTFIIRPGDHIFVPMGTRHSVTVEEPNILKVLSIQSPRFDGTDRITTKQGSY